MENELRQYELICILSPYLEGADLSTFRADLEKMLANNNGKIIHFMEPEKRELAYPINKQKEGIYLESHIEVVPENVISFLKELKSNKNILRHLINTLEIPETKAEKPRTAPRPIKPKKIAPIQPKETKAEGKMDLQEIDKKLDELMGI